MILWRNDTWTNMIFIEKKIQIFPFKLHLSTWPRWFFPFSTFLSYFGVVPFHRPPNLWWTFQYLQLLWLSLPLFLFFIFLHVLIIMIWSCFLLISISGSSYIYCLFSFFFDIGHKVSFPHWRCKLGSLSIIC